MSVSHGQCDARPTVTFPAARHHCPLAGTKLYCLVTEAHVMYVNNLPRVALDSREARIRTRDLSNNSDEYIFDLLYYTAKTIAI